MRKVRKIVSKNSEISRNLFCQFSCSFIIKRKEKEKTQIHDSSPFKDIVLYQVRNDFNCDSFS